MRRVLLTGAVFAASVSPDFHAVNGSGLDRIVGALLTLALIASVTALIVSAISWAIGQSSGSWQLASRGRIGVFVALGTAMMSGGAIAWLNFLIGVGATL